METYLGDGLYASFDGWMIEVYSSDGIHKVHRIYFEPETLRAFLRYVESLRKKEAQ